MHKHIRDCRALCEDVGLTVIGVDTRRRHLVIQCAEGSVVMPSTPGDRRWRLNARGVARRVLRDA